MGLVARVKGGAHRAKLALLPAGRRPMEGSALAPTWRFRDPKTGTTHRGLEPSVMGYCWVCDHEVLAYGPAALGRIRCATTGAMKKVFDLSEY